MSGVDASIALYQSSLFFCSNSTSSSKQTMPMIPSLHSIPNSRLNYSAMPLQLTRVRDDRILVVLNLARLAAGSLDGLDNLH